MTGTRRTAIKSKTFKIYGLFDPRCGTLRYVGRTKMKLRNRLRAHVNNVRNGDENNHRANWIRELISEDLWPIIRELERVDSEIAAAKEYAWIQQFLEEDVPLTNAVIAEANDPKYPAMTEETRRKMSESHKGLMTEEQRQRASEFMKELWQDPEYQARVSAGLKRAYEETDFREKVSRGGRGLKRSRQTKKRISKAQKRRFEDPKEREKQSEMFKAYWALGENRAKASRAAKERWATPEFRARHDAGESARKAKMQEYYDDPEWMEYHRRTISEGVERKWEDPEFRRKQKEARERNLEQSSEQTKKLWEDEEFRKKQRAGDASRSAKMKELWKDPEYRERQLSSRRKARQERGEK